MLPLSSVVRIVSKFIFSFVNWRSGLGTVIQAHNPRIWKAEAGGLQSYERATEQDHVPVKTEGVYQLFTASLPISLISLL